MAFETGQLDEVLLPGSAVVFDADGTLWRGDVGEDWLRRLAFDGLVPADAYAQYERHLAQSPAKAYGWAVEVLDGLEETRVKSHASAFFEQRYAGRLFREMRRWVGQLCARGCEVWVCSASPRVSVVPGARLLGIAEARVIGVECTVDGGRMRAPVALPVSCGPGKVTWLERRLGRRPAVAVGNGELDLDMLAWAERAVVVAPLDGQDNSLVREAVARQWPVWRM